MTPMQQDVDELADMVAALADQVDELRRHLNEMSSRLRAEMRKQDGESAGSQPKSE